jgi:hypothetical protein
MINQVPQCYILRFSWQQLRLWPSGLTHHINTSSEMLVSTHKLHTTTQNTIHNLNITAMCPMPSGVNYWGLVTKIWRQELRSCQVAWWWLPGIKNSTRSNWYQFLIVKVLVMRYTGYSMTTQILSWHVFCYLHVKQHKINPSRMGCLIRTAGKFNERWTPCKQRSAPWMEDKCSFGLCFYINLDEHNFCCRFRGATVVFMDLELYLGCLLTWRKPWHENIMKTGHMGTGGIAPHCTINPTIWQVNPHCTINPTIWQVKLYHVSTSILSSDGLLSFCMWISCSPTDVNQMQRKAYFGCVTFCGMCQWTIHQLCLCGNSTISINGSLHVPKHSSKRAPKELKHTTIDYLSFILFHFCFSYSTCKTQFFMGKWSTQQARQWQIIQGCEWLTSHPGHFTPGQRPLPTPNG